MEYKSIAEKTIGHLYSAHRSVRISGIDTKIIAMVELYVSQINGCAYCCSFHSNELREMGVAQSLIDKLPGFRHSKVFSEEQNIALEWAESLTLIDNKIDIDPIKSKLLKYFNERQFVELTASISLMNALNRLRISLGDKD